MKQRKRWMKIMLMILVIGLAFLILNPVRKDVPFREIDTSEISESYRSKDGFTPKGLCEYIWISFTTNPDSIFGARDILETYPTVELDFENHNYIEVYGYRLVELYYKEQIWKKGIKEHPGYAVLSADCEPNQQFLYEIPKLAIYLPKDYRDCISEYCKIIK